MCYTFDRCLVDTASREVALDGTAMALSPKAFELLTLLIDASARARQMCRHSARSTRMATLVVGMA